MRNKPSNHWSYKQLSIWASILPSTYRHFPLTTCLCLGKHGQQLRAGPRHLSRACCCSSSPQCSRVARAEVPMHPPSPPRAPGLFPAVTAASCGIRINTVCTTRNHSQNAKSNYLIALICALVRSTEHNYILALKRVKKKALFWCFSVCFSAMCLKGTTAIYLSNASFHIWKKK